LNVVFNGIVLVRKNLRHSNPELLLLYIYIEECLSSPNECVSEVFIVSFNATHNAVTLDPVFIIQRNFHREGGFWGFMSKKIKNEVKKLLSAREQQK
jgi:hypothetical protein